MKLPLVPYGDYAGVRVGTGDISLTSPLLIALTGISGSGKSTIAQEMAKRLDATLFEQDTTLIERAKRRSSSFLAKFDIEEANHYLKTLVASHPVTYMGYSQVTGQRTHPVTLLPRSILIVEGVLVFQLPMVRDHAALAFWVEAPLDICEERQLARWRREGWYAGLSEAEVLSRTMMKRTEELPIILDQRPLCTLTINNSVNRNGKE